jgi:hypothetical protein
MALRQLSAAPSAQSQIISQQLITSRETTKSTPVIQLQVLPQQIVQQKTPVRDQTVTTIHRATVTLDTSHQQLPIEETPIPSLAAQVHQVFGHQILPNK